MRTREIIPGKLYTRGEPNIKHLPAIRERKMVVFALTTRPNEDLQREWPAYYHIPLADGRMTADNETAAWTATNLAMAAIRLGHPVLVHCHAGRNRTGLVASMILSEYYGITGREALERFRALRPRAVNNEHFEAYLNRLK